MLSLKTLLQVYLTIIINNLITKEVEVITRLKKERGRRRVPISELLPWALTIKRRIRPITSVRAAPSVVRSVTLRIVIALTTRPKSEQC
jgi:hypothetical protein